MRNDRDAAPSDRLRNVQRTQVIYGCRILFFKSSVFLEKIRAIVKKYEIKKTDTVKETC